MKTKRVELTHEKLPGRVLAAHPDELPRLVRAGWKAASSVSLVHAAREAAQTERNEE